MLRGYPLKSFLKFAFFSAILYLIPATIFIQRETFPQLWLLYLGNALFLFSMIGFMILYKPPSDKNTHKMFMLYSGHIVTAMATILACILLTLIILVLKPSFYPVSAVKSITQAPPNTNGLAMSLYLDAIFGNVSAGSFASIITFFASRSKYSQTPEM